MKSAPIAMLGRARPVSSGNMTVVQALRGIAAFWVVLFHVAEGHHIDALLATLPAAVSTPLFHAGHYGVAIFFALSGFVIAHSLRDADVDGRYFGRFVLRRSIRLDPPYWGAMLISVVLALVSASVKHEAYASPSFATVIAHLFYLQEILRLPEINSVFWTLTYEVQFYIVLCLSLLVIRRLQLRRVKAAKPVVLLMLFGLALGSATGLIPVLLPGLFTNLWQAFFVGALAYWSLSRPIVRVPFALLLIAMAVPLGRDYAFGAVSAASAVLLFTCGMTGTLYTGLRWRWLQLLGLISYSLYLLHNPIGGATGFVVRKVVGDGLIANLVSLTTIVAATVGVAALYFYVMERPVHRWSRKIALNKQPRAADDIAGGPSL